MSGCRFWFLDSHVPPFTVLLLNLALDKIKPFQTKDSLNLILILVKSPLFPWLRAM